MREIEILVNVHSEKSEVLQILEQFLFKGEKETVDTYYFDPLRSNFKFTDGKFPREWFRLRRKGQKYFMTYKNDNFDNETWLYSDEEEIEISDLEVAKTIVKKLGLEELVIVNNRKFIYENEKYEIVFEEVENLGLFLEVEALKVDNNEDVQKIKQEIRDFIKNLGISVGAELNAGKPELLLAKIGIPK